jgi:hypothetical protein
MCGLIYVKRKDGLPAYKSVLKRYRRQKQRGQDGFGYVAVKDNRVVAVKRAATEHEIVQHMQKENAPEILFHHRFPTSTPNTHEVAHPMEVNLPGSDYRYLIAHNGVIRNTKELKEAHEKLGIKYKTEITEGFMPAASGVFYTTRTIWNDSESIAIETALVIEGKKETIDTQGAAAVIGFRLQGDRVVDRFAYRNYIHPLAYHNDQAMTEITTLGRGVPITVLDAWRIKENGEVEQFVGVGTPFAGVVTQNAYSGGNQSQLALPARHPITQGGGGGMGFLNRRPRFSDSEYPEDWHLGMPQGGRSGLEHISVLDLDRKAKLLEEAELVASDNVHMQPATAIFHYTTEKLWEEHEEAVGVQKDIKGVLSKLVVELATTDNMDLTLAKVELEAKLDATRKYEDKLFNEIVRRDPSLTRLAK